MKHIVCFAFLLCFTSTTASAAHKKPVKNLKKSVASRYGKPSNNKLVARRKQHAAPIVAVKRSPRQAAPSNDRYREIQQSLAQKGYLATEPNGVWDQNSQDAMKRFQSDQKLGPSGKLTARSIIALGLGAPTAAPALTPNP